MKHLQQGEVDLIVTQALHDGDPTSPLTGLATVVLRIYRASDRQFFDFNDSTFKAGGHTTIAQTMTQLDATNAPGVYYYAWTTPAADDTYHYLVTETGASAKNIPQAGEVFVGDWVDDIDAAITSRAAPGANMNLADDAITSAKYDETTAYPLAQADTGASAVARTGADADTLKTLSDQIDGLNDLSSAAVQAACAAALAAFGTATDANVDAVETAILAAIGALEDLSQAQAQVACAAALAAYDAATGSDVSGSEATIVAAIGALNDLSSVEAQAAAAAALTAYGASTGAEVSAIETSILAAIAGLNDLDSATAQAACVAALTAFGAATEANVDGVETAVLASIAGLEDLSQAQAQAACAAALTALNFDSSSGTNLQWLFERWMNRLELGNDGYWRLYNTADNAVQTTWGPIADVDDNTVVPVAGTPAKRPKGV